MEKVINGATHEYTVTIQLREPLSIGARPQVGNDIHSVRFIPGTVWRGALAAEKMRRMGWGWSDPEAQAWLELHFNFPNRFGDCRAQGSKLVMADEYWPKHGGRNGDSNVRGVDIRKNGRFEDMIQKIPDFSQKGLVRQVPRWEESMGVRTEVVMHSAIDSRTGAVEPSKLFSVECLEAEPQTFFRGNAMLYESLLEDELFRPVGDGGVEVEITLGRKRTSGNGRALLSINPKSSNESPERLTRSLPQPSTQPFWIHVTVQSDLLLYDSLLQETMDLDLAVDVLGEKIGGPTNGIIVTESQSWRMISLRNGWNQTWGRPKETAMCIAPGSIFSYLVQLETSCSFDQIVDKAMKAIREGVGWRRSEGFGEIHIHFGDLPSIRDMEEESDQDSKVYDVKDELIIAVTDFMRGYRPRPFPESSIMYRISSGIVRGDWKVDDFLSKDPNKGFIARIMERHARRTGVSEFFGELQDLYKNLQSRFESESSSLKGQDLLVQFILIVLAEYRICTEKGSRK